MADIPLSRLGGGGIRGEDVDNGTDATGAVHSETQSAQNNRSATASGFLGRLSQMRQNLRVSRRDHGDTVEPSAPEPSRQISVAAGDQVQSFADQPASGDVPQAAAQVADVALTGEVMWKQAATLDTSMIDLPQQWPNPAGKIRYRRIEGAALRLMDYGWRRKDPGNPYVRRFGHAYRAPIDPIAEEVAQVPGGLVDCVADIHTHPVGYDHRYRRTFVDLLMQASPTSFILVGSIPQHCGESHYSSVNTLPARMKHAARMDVLNARSFMRLYEKNKEAIKQGDEAEKEWNLSLLARADMSFTGLDPSKPGTVAYMKKRLTEYPGVYISAGELTGQKEMVNLQLGKDAFIFGNPESLELLGFVQESGMLLLVHNDWGHHGLHEDDMRPEAVHTAYENFERLIGTLEQYPDANVVLAHTGIGRFVRPDAGPLVEVDAPQVMGMRNGRPVVLQPAQRLTAPKHIALMYDAIRRVPKLKFDISWNDVGEAFITDPVLRKGLVDFIVRNPDRITFGSDTVKPVNPGQYNQALMLFAPIIADVAMISKEAAWKLVRGNYEATIFDAGSKVRFWTQRELQRQLNDPRTPPLERSRITARLASMQNMLEARAPKRREISLAARQKFDVWYDALIRQRGRARQGMAAAPGEAMALRPRPPRPVRLERFGFEQPPNETAYAQINRQLPDPQHQTWPNRNLGEYGPGTVHGDDYKPDEVRKVLVTGAAVGGVTAATVYAGANVAKGIVQQAPRSIVAQGYRDINPSAFIIRAVLVALKTAYSEGVRLKWEEIFEQAHVTNKDLNIFVDRLIALAPSFGIAPDRLDKVVLLTEQFRANMQRLYDKPLSSFETIASDPRRGVTDDDRVRQKFNVIMSEVGRYQINVDRALARQASSINALDPRAEWGRKYRAATAATYIFNVISNLGFMLRGPHLGGFIGDVQTAVQVLFGLANAAMLLQTVAVTVGGRRRMNLEAYGKTPLPWGSTLGNAMFTATGVPWTLSDLADVSLPANVSNAADLVASVGTPLAKAALDVAFSSQTYRIAENELRRNARRRMRQPAAQASPAYWMTAALVVRELLELFRPS